MRAGAIVGAGLLFVVAASAAAQALYSPPEGDFAVAFPSSPKVEARPAERSKDIGRRLYIDQEPTQILIVSIDEYPDNVLPQLVDAGVYDRILRQRAADDPTRLISTRAARLSGRPCLEGVFHDPNDSIAVVRVLMIGDRIYELSYVHPEEADQSAAANAFFNSFKIAPKD